MCHPLNSHRQQRARLRAAGKVAGGNYRANAELQFQRHKEYEQEDIPDDAERRTRLQPAKPAGVFANYCSNWSANNGER